MGWATRHIAKLEEGEVVKFRPTGNSMTPIIKSKQLVTVEPIKDTKDLEIGDVVLCKVQGREYLHKINAVRTIGGPRPAFQICNNKGFINGWTYNVYGKMTNVEE